MEKLEALVAMLGEVLEPYEPTEEVVEAIRLLLDNRYEGLIVVDAEGRIAFMNRGNEKFLGLGRGEAKGRPVVDLIPSSRLHVVCRTGEPEIGEIQEIQGKAKIVARVPIKRGKRLLGAMGSVMFRDLEEVHRLTRMVRLLESRVASYEKRLRALPAQNRYTFQHILGTGRPLVAAVELAKRAAAADANVLIIGETGTGKELFAHAIHNASPRVDGPFVRLNCAAIPRELAESELFGYEPGSFSGADRKGRVGKFEQAHGGTIFLDEIGELPLDMQAKILRVLQEKEVERVGGTAVRYVDFRLIAATNVDLFELVEQGRFRADLYYRLSKLPLRVPPLREHPEDIEVYVRHFLETRFDFLGSEPREVDPEAFEALSSYRWPGNVRELENVVERVAWHAPGARIRLEDLPPSILSAAATREEPSSTLLRDAVEEAEKKVIQKVLALTGNNKNRAAKLLAIHRTTLYDKLARYGIADPE